MSKAIDRAAFEQWLVGLGDEPCGTNELCPLALFSGASNTFVKYGAAALENWQFPFATKVDRFCAAAGGWPIPASKALAILRRIRS